MSDDLYENGEDDNGQGGADKHLTRTNSTGLQHFNQRETDSTTQSAVRHDELFLKIDWF